jgi:type IV fimbrial biogenesis protein FimT
MQTTMRRVRGFTLIELMMTLTVMGILIAVAAPAFGNLIQSTEAQSSRSTLTAALGTARILAVSKTENIVVCPSTDQQYCGHTTEWQHGWLIFVDTNHDGARNTDEDLLSVSDAQPEGVAILTTAGRTHINYRPDGSTPGSNVTFTVCDRRGNELATSLVINNAGRVRSGTPTKAAATACEDVLNQPRA